MIIFEDLVMKNGRTPQSVRHFPNNNNLTSHDQDLSMQKLSETAALKYDFFITGIANPQFASYQALHNFLWAAAKFRQMAELLKLILKQKMLSGFSVCKHQLKH